MRNYFATLMYGLMELTFDFLTKVLAFIISVASKEGKDIHVPLSKETGS